MGKTTSIMQREKKCYVCDKVHGLHLHHCLHGTANRKNADKYGLVIWLCPEHHTGQMGVHHNPWMDNLIKAEAQSAFEHQVGDRELFMSIFGKSYL